MPEPTSLAIGGLGTLGGGALIWQLWQMVRKDNQSNAVTKQASDIASNLMSQVKQAHTENLELKKENRALRDDNTKINMTLATMTADFTILKNQTQVLIAEFAELKKENKCLCDENAKLKKSSVVGKAGEGI